MTSYHEKNSTQQPQEAVLTQDPIHPPSMPKIYYQITTLFINILKHHKYKS